MAVSPLSPIAAPAMTPVTPSPALPVDPALIGTPAAAADDSADTNNAPRQDQPQRPTPSLEKALEEINGQMQAWSTQLQFKMDPDAQRLVVTIVDAETGDTLRTIPSDAVLRIAKMIIKMQGNAVETAA